MSEADLDRVKRIFHQVLEAPEPDRERLLDTLCGKDEPLRAQVESLLAADEGASDFLDSRGIGEINAVHAAAAAESESLIEGPGSKIGPYKLLQVIGEGGFGVVYMAEQETPIRRRVALKVVKPGMDTKQVIARFEAERQALAILDHPNIAKVFEAGATRTGRPYFVMELVRGIPITEYCDEERLDTRERLALFSDVCGAVNHAHQHGIIHRDIKPSNVLVTLHDGTPVPMVIDFGIAKATHQRLTDRTLFTEFNQFIGTPAYMAPEQAAYEGLDVDARSDVYSLGVLLYELLTGTTPFDAAVMKRAAYQEILRILKEEEPPKPSTRIGAMGKESATNAGLRRLDTVGLIRLLRGDLDWIVMKALEKDRRRRYESATDLADDINRYFSHQPILARRPSRIYKARKLFRRRRGPFVAAAGVVLALVAEVTYVNWYRPHGPAAAAPDGAPGLASTVPDPAYTLLLEDFNGAFELSPDGQRLAVTLREGNPPGLYISDPVSALPRLVRPLEYLDPISRPRWSPDGTRIAVLQKTQNPAGSTESEFILIVDQEGSEVSRIPIGTPVGTWLIAWAPDQQSLAYSRENAIYSVTLDGRATKLAGEEAVGFAPYLGGFSPDGRWLAYSTGNGGDFLGFDVWVIPAAGGQGHRLTQHQGMDLTPSWGADGSLYFVSDRGGSRNVWRLRVDLETGERLGEPEQVTTYTDAQVRSPSVAWDAGTMAYTMWRYRETVQVADVADPSSAVTLARGRALDLSPDGSQVLFRFELHDEAAVRQRADALYSILSTGGTPVRLTPESHFNIGPARFAADGSMVRYMASSADDFAEYRVSSSGGDPERARNIVLRSDFEQPKGGWSPDWSFQVLVKGEGLYRVPGEGEPTLLAERAEWDPDVAFSPDGRFVAVVGWEQPAAMQKELIINPREQVRQFRPSDIYLVPVQGGELRRLTTNAEPTQKSHLRWHPDGQRLTYTAQTKENVVDTRMAWLDGRPTVHFFDQPGVWELGGSWGPDGRTFYFQGHDSQNGECTYRRNPDGTVDLLWVGGEFPLFGRFMSADGLTLVHTAWKWTDEVWMIEGYR